MIQNWEVTIEYTDHTTETVEVAANTGNMAIHVAILTRDGDGKVMGVWVSPAVRKAA